MATMPSQPPKVIHFYKRGLRQATSVVAPSTNYSKSQVRQAGRFLHASLEDGWETFFTKSLRRTANGWTIMNVCPKCGHTPPQDMHSALERRRHMFAHAVSAH